MATKIGIVGTGFIARGVFHQLQRSSDFEIGSVLTRRPPASVAGFDGKLTNSKQKLVDTSDIVFECTGDAVYATEVLELALLANRPVVTMDSELHVTTGSWLASLGYITEADGDQPGCLARMRLEALEDGFTPLAYVNLKGYLNRNPTPDDMYYWSKRQSLRLDQVVSFTDGSKAEIERALVANGLNAEIPPAELSAATVGDLSNTDYLVDLAEIAGRPISDFVIAANSPPGVMLLADHDQARTVGGYLPFSRLLTEQGKAYQLLRPHHLCHLEVVRTLRRVVAGDVELLNNSVVPKVGVYAVAKRKLRPGESMAGLGGFEVRGQAMSLSTADVENLVPVCLLKDARLTRHVADSDPITFDDVELQSSRALDVFLAMRTGRQSVLVQSTLEQPIGQPT